MKEYENVFNHGLSEDEFYNMMTTGLAEALRGEGEPLDAVIAELKADLLEGIDVVTIQIEIVIRFAASDSSLET